MEHSGAEVFNKENPFLWHSMEDISVRGNCLNEGWADLTEGEEYTCQTKVIQFSKTTVFTGRPCCHTKQHFVVRSKKTFLNDAHVS